MKSALEIMMVMSKVKDSVEHVTKFNVDLYYMEKKGILIVKEGYPLIPAHVLYKVDEQTIQSPNVKITKVTQQKD